TQKNVLDATVRAADILGKPLRLVISPQTQDPAANDFKAQLLANANVTDGDVFQLHTESKPKNSGGGGGMFGGFGGLSGGGASPPPKQTGKGPVLVRLWLDVVESAPGRQPFKIRRIVLDRLNGVGDALAAGQSDALARLLLVQIWDGAADVGAFATPFILRTQNNELAAIRAAAAAAMGATSQDGKVSLDNQPPPVLSSAIVSLFFASDLARHFIGADIGAQMRSYYRMPRLAFMRRGFRVADWGAAVPSAVYAQDIDLLDPPLAITGPVNGVREFALRSGISDTALEAQAGMAHPRLGTLAVFAALPAGIAPKRYAQRSELPSDLPPPILAALRADVASGNTVVAPPALVAVNGVQAYGWWSFSDGTPYALGKMDLGGGQSMSEKGILVTKTVLKAIPYVKFLYSCYECGLAGATKSIGTFGSAGQAQFVGCMVKAICGFIVGVGFQLADMDTYDFREFQTMTQILGRLLGTATFRLGVSMGVGKACGLGLF
ncbi:MAG: hypothetical protein ACRESR_11215, partial [Gammaproteobacteria bacterium]